MRMVSLLAVAAALTITSTASAQTVPVTFSPEFQTALEEEYGVREGEILREAVVSAIANELTRRGVSIEGVTIEVTILDADPNRPTMQQLFETPGLDMRSISIGGAELRAVVRSASGQVTEVNHRRYNPSLEDVTAAATPWTEARRAIRQFAVKVADAHIRQ